MPTVRPTRLTPANPGSNLQRSVKL